MSDGDAPKSATLDASCENCESWKEAACSRGLVPDAGELYCGEYAITDAFRDQIATTMMAENPVPMQFTASGLAKLQKMRRTKGLAKGSAPKQGAEQAAPEPRVGRHSARRAKK